VIQSLEGMRTQLGIVMPPTEICACALSLTRKQGCFVLPRLLIVL
jgi:hypothetical protein